jgi:hypothetical protein
MRSFSLLYPLKIAPGAQEYNSGSITEKKANPAGGFQFKLISECWSTGVMEYWLKGGYFFTTLQHSITPVLHDSETQGL